MNLPKLTWFGNALVTKDGRSLTDAEKEEVKKRCETIEELLKDVETE